MSEADVKNGARYKQVDVKVKFVETGPDEFCSKICPADLTLIIEGKSLLVSKFLLGNLSPVFDAMFSGNFREKDQRTITLPGKKFNNFVEFMRCMNPHISKPVTVDNVYDVFPLAHEYEVKHLLPACERALTKLSESAADELYNVLKIATMYNLDELTANCIKLAADRPPGEIEEVGRTYELDKHTINAVKAQTLTNLTTKHKDIHVHITTCETLYRILGIQSKQLKLVTAFKNGKVLGDFRKLQVSITFNKAFDMCINDDVYLMKIQKTCVRDGGWLGFVKKYICLTTKRKSVHANFVRCVSGIYIKNWICEEMDIYLENTFVLHDSSVSSFTWPDKYSVDFLSDIKAGYVQEGMLDVEVYLFIVNK